MNEASSTVDGALSERIAGHIEANMARAGYSAAACVIVQDGRTLVDLTLGTLASFGPDGERMPDADRVAVTSTTLFDLASLTKIFSAHSALSVVAAGRAELDAPLADMFPEYREGDRARVTLRQLLSHTSGLPATWSGWRPRLEAWLAAHPSTERLIGSPLESQRAELMAELLRTPLDAPPGARFEYACTGYNTAMAYVEAVTGESWRALVKHHTLEPLGLTHITATPDRPSAAATELQPQFRRGIVQGVVHDETSWSLGGGTGNAGLFGTAHDVAAFGEAVRTGEGRVRGELMWDDALSGTLGRATAEAGGDGFGSALGLRIGDAAFMGRHFPDARGHTGFTGTSLVIDRDAAITIVLLTNRVHPTRAGAGLQPLRARIADEVGAALGAADGR